MLWESVSGSVQIMYIEDDVVYLNSYWPSALKHCVKHAAAAPPYELGTTVIAQN